MASLPQETDPPDPLVAAVLSAGIWRNLIKRESVVRWADYRIEQEERPSAWMIDLSLSQNLRDHDLTALLDTIGATASKADVCRELYGFLPSPDGYTFDRAEALAKQAYSIAWHFVSGDWDSPILRDADWIGDQFYLTRDGSLRQTEKQTIEQLRNFLDSNRSTTVKTFLGRLAEAAPDDQ